MRFVAGRGAAAKSHREDAAGQGADAEVFLAVGAVAKKHREEASGKRVQDWQPRARLASVCPGYFCLGGALRGYILSITSIGTPRIRCSCLFVAE